MTMMRKLTLILEKEEGYRESPYLDSRGLLTVGIGTLMSTMTGHDPADYKTFTVSRPAARTMLTHEVSEVFLKLCKVPTFVQLSGDRQVILLSMAYQLGYTGLRKFSRMWKELSEGNWNGARFEALDSAWHIQTPERAMRHASVLGGKPLDVIYGDIL